MRHERATIESTRKVGFRHGIRPREDSPLEDAAAEIGATRQGFSKLLRWPDARYLFDTFVRGCFLRREAEAEFAIVVRARGTG